MFIDDSGKSQSGQDQTSLPRPWPVLKYDRRRWNPFLVSVPDIGVGVFWALSGTVAPWIIYNHTQSNFQAMLIMSMGAFTGIFMQILSGILSDRTPYTGPSS